MSEPLLLGPPKTPSDNAPAIDTTASVTWGEENIQPKVSTLNKILGAARKIFSKHGLEFWPGQSSGHEPAPAPQPGLGGTQTPPPFSVPPAGPAPVPLVDEIFAQECIEGVISGFLSMRNAGLLSMAVKVTADKQWAKENIARIAPSDSEISAFVKNVIIILKKYNIPLTWLPELSALVTLVRWEMRYRGFVRELKEIIEARERAEKAKGGVA